MSFSGSHLNPYGYHVGDPVILVSKKGNVLIREINEINEGGRALAAFSHEDPELNIIKALDFCEWWMGRRVLNGFMRNE